MRAISGAIVLLAVCYLATAQEWLLAIMLALAGGCLFVGSPERR